MNVIKTVIDSVLIIDPLLYRDSCGYSFESWKKRMPQSRDTVFTSAQTMSLSVAMFEVLNEECI